MEEDGRFSFQGVGVRGLGPIPQDVSLSRDKEREEELRTSTSGLENSRLLRAYKEDKERENIAKSKDATSVSRARASVYLFGCCFYNCLCCLPSRWTRWCFGPLCGNEFCCKQAICCQVELRRDRWLGLTHTVCFVVHLSWAIASFTAGAGKDMEVDIFRVKPAWNNTGRNGYDFEVEKAFDIRIDTVTGLFFLLSALSHSVWALASIASPTVWGWLTSYIDNCFCWWRFLEYSLSASLMLMAIGMITGLRDMNSMLGVFMLNFTTMLLGLITEMLSRPESPDKWMGDPDPVDWDECGCRSFAAKFRSYSWRMFPHFIGWIPYIAAWAIVLGNFFRQIADLPQHQQDRIPWFVPWAIYGTAVVFTSFSFVQIRYQWTAPKHYWRTEIIYCALSLSAKVYLGSLLYTQIIMAESFDAALS